MILRIELYYTPCFQQAANPHGFLANLAPVLQKCHLAEAPRGCVLTRGNPLTACPLGEGSNQNPSKSLQTNFAPSFRLEFQFWGFIPTLEWGTFVWVRDHGKPCVAVVHPSQGCNQLRVPIPIRHVPQGSVLGDPQSGWVSFWFPSRTKKTIPSNTARTHSP